jgi:hydroxymethylpyrimidine/phosphomethylpyrimidine kinase
MIANVLSIAGSDPSGGAGIQADLKAFSARGVFGMAALTALTAQNTQGVSAVHALPADFVAEQIRMVFADIRVDAVKIGMIANAEIAAAVAEALHIHCRAPVVLDPVMIAKGGAALLDPEAIETVQRKLLPLATVVTPNLPEAAALLDQPEAQSREEMAAQAVALLELGPAAALIKGGHLSGEDSPDVLATEGGLVWFESPRTHTKNTHGTGCSLSSAIAAELGKGQAIPEAIGAAKHWLSGAIGAADALGVGSGHGPIHHFHHLWPEKEFVR